MRELVIAALLGVLVITILRALGLSAPMALLVAFCAGFVVTLFREALGARTHRW